MPVFAKAGRGDPTLMGCEVELVIERCCFFAFLLPGINNSHTVEAILEMLGFFQALLESRMEVSQIMAICKV